MSTTNTKNKNNVLIPTIVEKDPNSPYERAYDIYSRLLKDFIVFITGPVETAMANTFIAQILYLQSVDAERDIKVYINTPGGSVSDGLAMYDTMLNVKNTITTINLGLAASMGSVLMQAGSKGQRFALPNSRIMIHQPLWGTGPSTQISDIEIVAKEGLRTKKNLIDIFVEKTGKTAKEVEKDMDRDNWLNSEESLNYGKHGLIDKILTPEKDK
jgi:ATP-dependent Clp protease protease subunit